jgi:ribosomal subunit interface protein
MINVEITGRNFEIDDKLREYVEAKFGGLEKYLPRRARANAFCAVVIADDPSGREDNRYVCDAVITVASGKMFSREGTVNAYAAVDIVEAKLKSQLKKYKEKHTLQPRRYRMLFRLIGRKSNSEPDATTPEELV